MATPPKSLTDAALALSADERVELIDTLIHSLESPHDPANRQAWVAEATRRLDEVLQGKTGTLPGDQVMAELRTRLER